MSTNFEVFGGVTPYHDLHHDMQVMLAIGRGERPTRPPGIPDLLWQLISLCCSVQAADRPDIQTILRYLRVSMVVDGKVDSLTAKEVSMRVHILDK